MSDDEARRKALKPRLDAPAAARLIGQLYDLDVEISSVRELDSYDDRNFYFVGRPVGGLASAAIGSEFVFKVHNGVESERLPFIASQNEAMRRVTRAGLACPTPVPSRSNRLIELVDLRLRASVEAAESAADAADAAAGVAAAAAASAVDADADGAVRAALDEVHHNNLLLLL